MHTDGEKLPERDVALLEAEVRRVLHALAPYGVLREDALAKACRARRWRAGQFETALDTAVRRGRLRRLPFGFYASASTPDDTERQTSDERR